MANVNKALGEWSVRENNCWTNSMVALCWVNNPFKNQKTFVSNRVHKILDISGSINLNWRHVPTEINSADHESLGASIQKLEKIQWWKGADQLIGRSNWPQETEKFNEAQGTALAEEELKQSSELVLMALGEKNDEWDILLQKSTLKKTRRVIAWCLRFCKNALPKKEGKPLKLGPLKPEELVEAD